MRRLGQLGLLCALLCSCGGGDSDSPVAAPGAEAGAGTRALQAGAAVLQDKPPVEAINAYLDGFHFYNGRPSAQMEAHHYCTVLGEEVIQCVIYDGNTRRAKLMGVEYIVSRRLFETLADAERPLWHSHVHEVKSGQLVAPGIPGPAEHALMEKLVGTYGKTWHTWNTDAGHPLPLGVPQLMMGFTADGQLDPALLAERDLRLDVDSHARRQARSDIAAPPVVAGADAWQAGRVIQLEDPTGTPHHASGDPPGAAPPPPDR